jgi:hypothetical protein
MCGSEGSRHAANYKAYRALFLLLQTAPYQLIRMDRASGAVSTHSLRNHRRLFRSEQLIRPPFSNSGSDGSADHRPRP